MKQFYKLFLLILLSFLITSCSTFYDISDTSHSKYVKPNHIDANFDISGRFFIKTTGNNQYGNFTWYKESDNEELTFNTPIGQVVAKIVINNHNATLYTTDKKYSGDDLTQLMINNLGFSIPVSYLHYWVQGVGLPNVRVDNQTNYGFSQLGWQIEYLDWYKDNYPKVIKINKGDTSIKLFIVWG